MAALDVAKIRGVLLADGWHEIVTGTSFEIEDFTFINRPVRPTPQSYGFRFKDKNGMVAGPLTSILAVRYSQ